MNMLGTTPMMYMIHTSDEMDEQGHQGNHQPFMKDGDDGTVEEGGGHILTSLVENDAIIRFTQKKKAKRGGASRFSICEHFCPRPEGGEIADSRIEME